MKYRWARCPKCGCELSINFSNSPSGVAGSLRRWSVDRSINDGRAVRVAAAEIAPDGGFTTACVCGQAIPVPGKPDAVSAEREGNLRVKLGEE
jgi:hypothetical protein